MGFRDLVQRKALYRFCFEFRLLHINKQVPPSTICKCPPSTRMDFRAGGGFQLRRLTEIFAAHTDDHARGEAEGHLGVLRQNGAEGGKGGGLAFRDLKAVESDHAGCRNLAQDGLQQRAFPAPFAPEIARS